MTILERAIEKAGETDQETGCSNTLNKEAFELCRQNYFIKQQNQILQDKQPETNSEIGSAEVLDTTTQAQTQTNNSAAIGTVIDGINPPLLYAVTIIATAIITVAIIKYFNKGNKKL